MRRRLHERVLPWAVGAVAALFLSMAVPHSPVAGWMVGFLMRSHRSVRPAPIANGNTPTETTGPPPLRVAVAAMVSPERTFLRYREIFQKLADRLGRPLDFVQRKTYDEVNELLLADELDMAWVCTGALDDLRARGGVQLLAVPVVGGRTGYRSYVIVSDASRARTVEDLRGKRFAFTDPLSLTGRKVIVQYLRERGTTPAIFFASVFFTHAHDNSIQAVRHGLADAAAVDSLVYDWLLRTMPGEVRGTRIVWKSPWFPIPPLVAPREVDRWETARMQKLLFTLGKDPEGRKILQEIGVDRFVAPDPAVYLR